MASGLAILLGLALGAEASLEGGLQAEARARNVVLPGGDWTHAVELSTTPRLTAWLADTGERLTLSYAPQLVTADVPGPVDVLHAGTLEGRLHAAPRLELAGLAAADHGWASLLREARRDEAGGVLVSSTGRLRRTGFRGVLEARAALARGAAVTGLVTVERGGGDGAAYERILPWRRAWRADLSWSDRAGRHDTLGLTATASEERFSVGSRSLLGAGGPDWRRALSARLELHAAALLGYARTVPATGPVARRTVLGGSLGLVRARPERHGTDRVLLRAVPVVDRISGDLVQLLEAELRTEGDLAQDWWLGARATGARHVREGADLDAGHGELRLRWRAGARLALSGGLYGVWQHTAAAELPSFYELGAFLGLSWGTRLLERASPTPEPGAPAEPGAPGLLPRPGRDGDGAPAPR